MVLFCLCTNTNHIALYHQSKILWLDLIGRKKEPEIQQFICFEVIEIILLLHNIYKQVINTSICDCMTCFLCVILSWQLNMSLQFSW